MKSKKKFGLLVGGLSALGGAAITGAVFGTVYAVNANKEQLSLKACVNDAYGYINAAMADAIVRQPAMYDEFKETEKLLKDALNSNWITPKKAMAIGMMAGGCTELQKTFESDIFNAIVRQPDLYSKLKEQNEYSIQLIENGNDYFALSIGWMAPSLADASARQPEALDKINKIIKEGVAPYSNKFTSNNWIGVAKGTSSLLDVTARQPEIHNKLYNTHAEFMRHAIDEKLTYNQSFALGSNAGTCFDAMARQPEIHSTLEDVLFLAIFEIKNNSPEVALGYGKAAAVFDAMARQPELFNVFLDMTINIVYASLHKANYNSAEKIGIAASETYNQIARSPYKSEILLSELQSTIDYLLKNQ